MIKNIIIISIIYCSTIDIIQAQQLSKKMGTHVNGERYRGSYKNGIKDGFGEWTHPDGDIYRGKFKAGVKRGNGTYTFKNGEHIPAVLKEISNTDWALINIIMAKFLEENSKTINAMERAMLFFGMIPLSQVFGWEINLLKKID